jgi:membrane associated rhomboid family serine protease
MMHEAPMKVPGGSLPLDVCKSCQLVYFLVVFGDNVEDRLGHLPFLLLVLLSHGAGLAAHVTIDPLSTVPVIGSSAGISGVIVFYALAFPRARIGYLVVLPLTSLVRIPVRSGWLSFPAYFGLLLWVALQLLGVVWQIHGLSNVSAVAHLGGAVAGLGFWLLHRGRERVPAALR